MFIFPFVFLPLYTFILLRTLARRYVVLNGLVADWTQIKPPQVFVLDC